MNIQWTKQTPYTSSCLSNLHFFLCFCYSWKDIQVFAYFKLYFQYLDEIQGDEGSIFSKVLDWKTRSCCQNGECNAVFKHTDQNIRVCLRSKKKSALIDDSGSIVAYWEESKQSKVLLNKCGLFQICFKHICVAWGDCTTPGKFCNFYLILETVFLAL